jgi:cytochrome c oxidase subunit I+III
MGMNFFVAASMMIIVPSGVQILAWIVTIWRGALVIRTPLLYIIAFIVLFILGGITGIMVASVPFDWQVHDTFFVVGHFHYVLVGAVVFPVFAAISYWFPKVTGRLLDERVGRVAFWVIFVSFHLTFFPMHVLGFQGMPRRVYTYLPDLQWDPLNLVVTMGAFLMATGVMIFFANMLISAKAGEPAGDNPWGADTLEWATSSPPPMYNFRRIPVVRSGNPLWDGLDPQAPRPEPALAWRETMADAPHGRRETISTTLMDAVPDHRLILPAPSLWPFYTAMGLSVGFVGVMVHWSLLVVGGVLAVAGLIGWHWPQPDDHHANDPAAAEAVDGLPARPRGRSPAWAGMAMLVAIELTAMGALLAGYFYLRIRQTEWPPGGIPHPDVLLPAVAAGLLLLSGLPMWLAERATRAGAVARVRTWVPLGLLLAAAYLALSIVSHARLDYGPTSHAYGSIVWTISGYSALHVVAVLVLGSMLWLLHRRQYLHGRRLAAVEAIGVYWYFVALSAVPVFVTLYVAPYFM